MIECKCGCGTLFEEKDKYGRKRSYVSGHNGRKYDDPTQYKREWNHRNRKSRYEYKKKFIFEFKAELIKSKGNACQHCGLKHDGKNQYIFDFHHVNPKTKEFLLNKNNMNKKSKQKCRDEADKCIILCANCHRTEHWGRG